MSGVHSLLLGSGRGVTPPPIFRGAAVSTTTGLSHSITLSVGTTSYSRRLVYLVASRSSTATPFIETLSVGGTGATALARSRGSSIDRETGAFTIDVPAGTPSSSVVVTFDENTTNVYVAAFEVSQQAVFTRSIAQDITAAQAPVDYDVTNSGVWAGAPSGYVMGVAAGIFTDAIAFTSTYGVTNHDERTVGGAPTLRCCAFSGPVNGTPATVRWQWGVQTTIGGGRTHVTGV